MHRKGYLVGDEVVLTVIPDEGYACKELQMNGEVVALSDDGTYSFTATESTYVIEPLFIRKIFAEDNPEWDILKQFDGVISVPKGHDGDSGWLKFYDKYRDLDLTLTVKDYIGNKTALRQVVWFEFINGKTASFSVTYSDGKYRVQSMNDTTFGWTPHHELSTTEIASYQDTDGIQFRIVRSGTSVDIYLDGTKVCDSLDLATNANNGATNITEDMAATVTIRHYGNIGHQVDIPFVITNAEVVEMYNTKLFFANDKKTNIADPFVLDNTAIDGYYYMYGTQGACYCYRSMNMMDWEKVGDTIEISDVVSTDIWAPEVVYDAEEKLYYMFFSATPKADATHTTDNATQVLLVATSKYPDKDFSLVNFMDTNSCGGANLHDFSEDVYPHFYAKYLMLDPAEYATFSDKEGLYLSAIDPHPYIDEDGTKYLFWVDSKGEDRICGVKMKNWLKPDWSTAKVLTHYGYYTADDWEKAQDGASVEAVQYELTDNAINEGPVIVKHNGKYYLTYSANNYKTNNYLVAQAVSDSILGDYRKLTMEEGGVLLYGPMVDSEIISGTGHHSFVTVGEQTYIVYHRHNDAVDMGSGRNHAIDEIKWITIKDEDGNDLDVMYVNGPTTTAQPKIEAYSDYKNIADEATVGGTSDASYLTDGLLSVSKYGEVGISSYIKETSINETTTFTFDFESAKTVKAVMVYNSSMVDTCFRNLAKIEFVCMKDGKEVLHAIEDVEFCSEYYQTNTYGTVTNIISGAAACAEVNESNVTAVRITVEVPEGQSSVGISEIKILGN